MRLSIIIPAFNEEKRINKVFDSILRYFKNKDYGYEVLVVDDGSLDKTSTLVKKRMENWPNLMLLSYGENRGKGYAVKYGMLRAKGDIRMFSDADNSTPFEEIDKFIPLFEKGLCDIAIGSRGLKESEVVVAQSWIKSFFGKLGRNIANLLLGLNVRDTQCGFKCFTSDSAKILFSKLVQERWVWDMEILFLARKHGMRIEEVPVRWVNDADSRVKPIDYIKAIIHVLNIRFSHIFDFE